MYDFFNPEPILIGYLLETETERKFYSCLTDCLRKQAELQANNTFPVITKIDSLSQSYSSVNEILKKQGFSLMNCIFYKDIIQDKVICLSLVEITKKHNSSFIELNLYEYIDGKIIFIDYVLHELRKTPTGLKFDHNGLTFSFRSMKKYWLKLKK